MSKRSMGPGWWCRSLSTAVLIPFTQICDRLQCLRQGHEGPLGSHRSA